MATELTVAVAVTGMYFGLRIAWRFIRIQLLSPLLSPALTAQVHRLWRQGVIDFSDRLNVHNIDGWICTIRCVESMNCAVEGDSVWWFI